MQISPLQALQSANRPVFTAQPGHQLLIAGAGGSLGQAVLQRLAGAQRFAHCKILAREPVVQGMRSVSAALVQGDLRDWPPMEADVAVLMFEPTRQFHERDRAFYTPTPQELPALAAWLHRSGVRSLAVVLPHAQGSLPQALKSGLASLDEHAVASLGFERVIFVRSAQRPAALEKSFSLDKLAQSMLSIVKFMVPASEQPVRAEKIALLVEALLQQAPSGCTVLAPEQVWRLSQVRDEDLVGAVGQLFSRQHLQQSAF